MNNRQAPVVVKFEYQLPAPENREIQIAGVHFSRGNLDEETGLVKWYVKIDKG